MSDSIWSKEWLKKEKKKEKQPLWVHTLKLLELMQSPQAQEQLQVALSWYLPYYSSLQWTLGSAEWGRLGVLA